MLHCAARKQLIMTDVHVASYAFNKRYLSSVDSCVTHLVCPSLPDTRQRSLVSAHNMANTCMMFYLCWGSFINFDVCSFSFWSLGPLISRNSASTIATAAYSGELHNACQSIRAIAHASTRRKTTSGRTSCWALCNGANLIRARFRI